MIYRKKIVYKEENEKERYNEFDSIKCIINKE